MASILLILQQKLAWRSPSKSKRDRQAEIEEDILMEIFSRLPVKTLFRLKSVCRRWNAIIEGPILASMHFINYTKNPARHESFETLIVYENQQGGISGNKKVIQLLSPDGDVKKKIRYMEVRMQVISGPCNGIFLLGSSQDSYDPAFMLWNPATERFGEVPVPKMSQSRNLPSDAKLSLHSCGFGIDRVANDIKIVLIRHFSRSLERNPGRTLVPSGCPSQVMVYSLGNGTWRELEDFAHQVEIVRFVECYRYLNGWIYWLCASPVAALGFDLANEVFRVIDDPVCIPDEGYLSALDKQLAVYRDSLALLINNWSDGYDVWLLDDEKWQGAKWLTIGPFVPKDMFEDMFVVGYWGVDRDQLILLVPNQISGNEMLLFDPVSKATKVMLSKCPFPSGVFVYEESLVPVGDLSLDE